ncbi:MAG: glucose-6-phosphate dehydrogenase assembly protein OpcA [Thermoleophilaceae bacterium]|jgi:glucose-6-phosphate dehydrogenase assembly protein OpcA
MERVWSAQGTSPDKIADALRDMLEAQAEEDQSQIAPARVLNLIVIVDRDWRGEVANRLERVGRYHPSRTVLCAVEKERTTLDAWARISTSADQDAGTISVCEERVEILIGPQHLARLETILDPLVVTDLSTVIWSPHGHPIDSVLPLAQVVLLDSVEELDARQAIERASSLLESVYVVDLAWLRTTPWRERIAATFDPPMWRRELGQIEWITVRARGDSTVSALLLLGWLASRLGWEPGQLVRQNGSMVAHATARRRDVRLQLEQTAQNVPGLSGITVGTDSGTELSLDRGTGGLAAKRRTRDGHESSWVVMGASRGEAGILGEGIRQALLRDPTYGPAMRTAHAMFG